MYLNFILYIKNYSKSSLKLWYFTIILFIIYMYSIAIIKSSINLYFKLKKDNNNNFNIKKIKINNKNKFNINLSKSSIYHILYIRIILNIKTLLL